MRWGVALSVAILQFYAGTAIFAQENVAEIISSRDPLSCFAAPTAIDDVECTSAAGVWQLSRLSYSVMATATALEFAGVGVDPSAMQSRILEDGKRFGFDLSLVTPTVEAYNLSKMGSDGPFGENANAVFALSVLSLESLYPGIAMQLGVPIAELSDVVETDGFDSFSAFAAQYDGLQGAEQSITNFVPFETKLLAGQTAVLDFHIAGFAQGPETNDLAYFPPQSMLPSFTGGGLHAELPLSLGFTEFVSAGVVQQAGLQQTPLPELPCIYCGDSAGGTPTNFSGMISLSEPAPDPVNGQALVGGFGASATAGASDDAVSACSQTCPANPDVQKADAQITAGKEKMFAGGALMIGGVVTSETGAGVIAAASGFALMSEGKKDITQGEIDRKKGIEACEKACPPIPQPGGGTPETPAPAPETPTAPATPTPSTPAPTTPASPDKEKEPEQPNAPEEGASASDPNVGMGIEGGVDEPPNWEEPKGPNGSRPKEAQSELSGGGSCTLVTFLDTSACKEPIYTSGDPLCVTNTFGEVSCGSPNTLLPPGALFATDSRGSLASFDQSAAGILYGDLAQAMELREEHPEAYKGLDGFTPVRGSSVETDLEDLLLAQQPTFPAQSPFEDLLCAASGSSGCARPSTPDPDRPTFFKKDPAEMAGFINEHLKSPEDLNLDASAAEYLRNLMQDDEIVQNLKPETEQILRDSGYLP